MEGDGPLGSHGDSHGPSGRGGDSTTSGSSAAIPGSTHGELFFPDTDPQLRESFVGSLVRQKPHGPGVLRWRRGNYVRFHGGLSRGICVCGGHSFDRGVRSRLPPPPTLLPAASIAAEVR